MRREGNKLEETKTGRERERELHSTRDEVVAETQKKRKKKKKSAGHKHQRTGLLIHQVHPNLVMTTEYVRGTTITYY